jgi:hypothetical protein
VAIESILFASRGLSQIIRIVDLASATRVKIRSAARGLSHGTTPAWQTTVALTWIDSIIDGRFDLIANHLWLHEEWLTELRRTSAIVGDANSHYPRIVDSSPLRGPRRR